MPLLTLVGIILVVVGLVGIFFVVAEKIPKLIKLEESQPLPPVSVREKIKTLLTGIKYSSYRPLALEWLEKNLRKLRVLILKIDNLFLSLIAKARERSQVWKIRSRAWMEHTHLKKKEQLKVLETLDKVEVSENLEKIKAEVAKDEDQALKEKIATLATSDEAVEQKADELETVLNSVFLAEPASENPEVSEEEKKYIDIIAADHKNADAYRALGFIYLNQKNYSDARACFRRVMKLKPEDQEVKNKLEEIKGLRGKTPR